MNKKEIDIVACFLVENCDAGDVRYLLKELNSDKLNEVVEYYQESSDSIEAMRELIQETAIDLWEEDNPKEHRHTWAYSRSWNNKPYWRNAVEKLKEKYIKEDDEDSLMTLEIVSKK